MGKIKLPIQGMLCGVLFWAIIVVAAEMKDIWYWSELWVLSWLGLAMGTLFNWIDGARDAERS